MDNYKISNKKYRLLIVDDEELNRELLADCLGDDYAIDMACDGDEALSKIFSNYDVYAAVLLDLRMPKMDGIAVLKKMAEGRLIGKLPVIVITSEQGTGIEAECLKLGVMDFVLKPFDFVVISKRVKNVVDLFAYQNFLEHKVAEQTKDLQEKNVLLEKQAECITLINQRVLDILGNVVECRDLESGEHITRVRKFSEILAEFVKDHYPEYGIDDRFITLLSSAAVLHDIGKISIPDAILLKPGKLTEGEAAIMRTHTIRGCEILEGIKGVWDDDYKRICYEVTRHHHEKWDGNGYPDHLKGDEIPLSAQLVGIADCYDALISRRVYKQPYGKAKAMEMIIDGECGMFNPVMMDALLRCREKFELVADAYKTEKLDGNNNNAEKFS